MARAELPLPAWKPAKRPLPAGRKNILSACTWTSFRCVPPPFVRAQNRRYSTQLIQWPYASFLKVKPEFLVVVQHADVVLPQTLAALGMVGFVKSALRCGVLRSYRGAGPRGIGNFDALMSEWRLYWWALAVA